MSMTFLLYKWPKFVIYINYWPYWAIWTLLELAKFTSWQQTFYDIIYRSMMWSRKFLDDMWLILLFYINAPSFMLKAFTYLVLQEFHFHKALTRICHFFDSQSWWRLWKALLWWRLWELLLLIITFWLFHFYTLHSYVERDYVGTK